MVIAVPPQPAGAIPSAELFRLTVSQYHAMARAGIFATDERVELLEGLLIRRDSPSVAVAAGMIDVSEIYTLTVGQYEDLVRLGILAEDDPVELIEGVLVQKMPTYPPHVGTVELARDTIRPMLPPGWRYRVDKPIILANGEPEPDGVIARGSRADDFLFHPSAADVALVIEVAEGTLNRDRNFKLRAYALAGIPVYWIINLIDRQIEVHTDPDPTALPEPTYRRRDVYTGDAAVPVPVANVTVPAAALLPPIG